jgi:putative endonuclease
MWYVYIILCQFDQTLYTGITNNLERRLKQHTSNKGAKYTKGRGPFTLVKCFTCPNKSEALKLEYKIKQISRKEKLNYEQK